MISDTHKTKYMTFQCIERKAKTSVWEIRSNSNGAILGGIVWYGPWRQYVMAPDSAVFNNGCLRDIAAFLDKLNEAQREARADG